MNPLMYLLSDIFSFLGFITIPLSVIIFYQTMLNKTMTEENEDMFSMFAITSMTIFTIIAALPIMALFFWISSLLID